MAEPGEAEAAKLRALAARANYLAIGRPDIGFSAKEGCRRAQFLRALDAEALRRVGMYVVQRPRLTRRFPLRAEGDPEAFVDSDFAGCAKTYKSTLGGGLLLGGHLSTHASSAQRTVAFSSDEAELASIFNGASEALGLQRLAADLGRSARVKVRAKASAAAGICRRAGLGTVRHLAVGQFWAQERFRARDF